MTDFDATDPAHQEDRMVRNLIQRQVDQGRLPMEAMLKEMPKVPRWSFDLYDKVIAPLDDPGRPDTPATHPEFGEWKKPTRDRIAANEDFRSTVYSDAAKGDAAPTVGYGFNLASPVSRNALKAVLGYTDDDIAALRSGKKSMKADEGERVLDAIIDATNVEITRPLGQMALTYRQRGALIDTAYNTGVPALASAGVFSKLKAGDTRGAVQALLSLPIPSNAKTGAPLSHVRNRRLAAARDLAGDGFDKLKDLFQ